MRMKFILAALLLISARSYGQLGVSSGGTGRTYTSPYGILIGGTITSDPMQQVSAGDSLQVLQSLGAGHLPVWSSLASPVYLSYTGTLSTPIQLSVLRGGVTVQPGSLSGARPYSVDTGVALYGITSNYDETVTGVTLSNVTYIGTGGFTFSHDSLLATLDITPVINIVSSFHPFADPLIVVLRGQSLKYIGGGFDVTDLAGVDTFDFPQLTDVIDGGFDPGTCPSLVSMSFPKFAHLYGGGFNVSTCISLRRISLPAFVFCRGLFNPSSNDLLDSMYFPLFAVIAGGGFSPSNNPSIKVMHFPSMKDIEGDIQPQTNVSLTTIIFDSLQIVNGSIEPSQDTSLRSVLIPRLARCQGIDLSNVSQSASGQYLDTVCFGISGILKDVEGDIILSNNALSVGTVNKILHDLVSLDGTGGTVLWGAGRTLDISGGSTAAPSGQGIVDAVTLTGRGATITTN